jgi:hypothetical protein
MIYSAHSGLAAVGSASEQAAVERSLRSETISGARC